MTLESITKCPICHQTSFESFLTCTDYTTTGEKFELIKCNTCSFIITSPRPNEYEITKYYQSDKYISHTGGSKTLFDKIYLLARSYALQEKRKLIEEHSTGRVLLDYGAGTGAFLTHCSKNGWKAQGVEPSTDAREKAQKFSNLPLYSSLTEVGEKKFDVITLWHVLEHIHTLKETLTQLASLVDTKGTLLIAVPNHESFDAKKYKNQWAAYDVPRHLWHFNKENMKALLEENGLTLVAIKPMKLDSFYVSLLSEGYQNPNKSKLTRMINAFCTGMKSNAKAKAKMNYSSLIYIASK